MLATARLVIVGGAISYRALFNWATPTMFVGTLLVEPLTQLLFFVYLGRQLGIENDFFFLVGNAVLVASKAGIFGGMMAVGNERRYATLGSVLLSARSRAAIFLGRSLPYAVNGLLVAIFTLTAGSLLLGLSIPIGSLPGLVLAMFAGALSCSLLGLTLGTIGLRLRDAWMISNIVYVLLLLLTGVNVPQSFLPHWLADISQLVPITHAADAARRLAAGDGMGAVLPSLAFEVLIGLSLAVVATSLFRVFEREGRRHGTFDAL
jgi:ABC-2 type transport system permease protein